jgi:Transmembrane secretion effector
VVALVQTADTLPVVLLALPAGVLADFPADDVPVEGRRHNEASQEPSSAAGAGQPDALSSDDRLSSGSSDAVT